MMNNQFLRVYLPVLLIGGLVGAVAMALFAPHSGKDTRGMIVRKSRDLKDQVVSTAENTSRSTGELVGNFSQQVRETAGSLFHRGRLAAEEFKSNIEEEAKSKSVQFGA